jgi:hypothetical protein
MNPQIDFAIVVIILVIVGNEVTSVKRRLKEVEGKLDAILKRLNER